MATDTTVDGLSVFGSKFSLSSAVLTDSRETTIKAASFTEIKGLISLPDLGDTTEITTFDTIEDTRRHKLTGVEDGGDAELTVAYDAADAGQIAARAAADDNKLRAFKLSLVDGSFVVFAGRITASRLTSGEKFLQNVFTIAITSGTFLVAPASKAA